MSLKGRPLELAIARAARAYREEGRALLLKQEPRMANGPGGTVIYAGAAPVDFVGAIGDSGAVVEAKETAGKSFPLDKLREDQRASLDAFEEYGFDCRIVIDFTSLGEVYIVPWFQIAAFIIAPWRKSLSLTWCRAFGQLVPESERDTKQRRCLFLDAKAHPESERCLLEIWDEREANPVISPDGPVTDDEPTAPHVSQYAGLTPEQISDRIKKACGVGIERQIKTQTKKRKWTRRRAS